MQRITLTVFLVLLLAACGGQDESDLAIDDPEEDGGAEADEDDGSEGDDGSQDAEGDQGSQEAAPEPDPSRVEDPCAEREGEELEAFLDVVSPVDGQHVGEEVELVGCANVPEGTVRYRVTSPDGDELLDEFTTAECGGPCVGEYATTLDLGGLDDDHDRVTLEVFWDSPADDGGEEDVTRAELVLEQ